MVTRWSTVDLRNASTISQKIRPLARSKKSRCNKEHRITRSVPTSVWADFWLKQQMAGAKSAYEEEEKTGYEATKAKTSEGLENTKEDSGDQMGVQVGVGFRAEMGAAIGVEGERLDDQVASENGSLETRMTRRPDTVVLNS
ncbi:hypothetical protein Tco_0210632 [Tanacetum coccineum]